MRLVSELRRRNVFRMAVLYVVAAWLILQVAGVLIDLAKLPDWIGTTTLWLLGVGFPIALIFSWFYEITAEGISLERDVEPGDSIAHVTGRRLDLIVISILSAAVILFAYDKWWIGGSSSQSIAVLPFKNMSADVDNEHFSDGMSEEILNLLAKIPDLKVIGRTSSFAYKGKNEDLRVIGKVLGVTTLLEGSVRKSPEKVRITAQLIDVSDGAHIWSETYDRTMTDIFAVQDDVAAAIIDALQIHVGVIPTRGRPTEIMDAYVLFLKARALANAFNIDGAKKVALESIEIDPEFAEAYELLASIYWAHAGGLLESPEAQRLMGEAAANALAIDSSLVLAQALYQSGNLATYSAQIELEALEQAARRQPDYPWTLGALVFNLMKAGYLQEALTTAERLIELDPLSPLANGRLMAALFGIGRTGEAFAALERLHQLKFAQNDWTVGEEKLIYKQDNIAIAHFEAHLEQNGLASDWVRELVAGARDPQTGEAYLDRRIPQIITSMPKDHRYGMQRRFAYWYLFFGFLDRYFEFILDLDLTDATWTEADDLIVMGTIHRPLGFTVHPKYLYVVEKLGIVDVWEKRGPPDFCEKVDGQWFCQ